MSLTPTATPEPVAAPSKTAQRRGAGWVRAAATLIPSMVLVNLSLLAIPVIDVDAWAFAITAGVIVGVGLCVTVGYHRYFSHRSFRTSRVFQFLLALGACLSLQRGPLWWAARHRTHHRHSDEESDPHSPVRSGFWHAHLGWMFSPSVFRLDYAVVKDFAKYPELVWLDRLWLMPGMLFALSCYLALGWSGVVIGYFLAIATMWQATFCVNSVCHLFGSRRFETGESSRNNWVIAVLTNGEGWHNNHHQFPYSARVGLRWYELDSSYALIRLLAWLGLVWDVKLPPEPSAIG